ncbi:hypothetical protein F5Y00DRAFT_204145 [Daldinia vernicosa]|uniref:uncharacterized protein n=1 Tax=Daldinia vernicosa TaxID=114800 RepID=UPI002008833D|nr:uncharacterized protein F5Y00DRAFT_204145 [Daldinia vernicosa]KAI0851953.1 hypothetical protein F5Y00DRAFT_204145 [Daldinia vernicosa]
MSVTGDLLPFVGQLDASLTGRHPDLRSNKVLNAGYKQPNEWISAGFGGDGLMWTWLSGVAVGVMIAGSEDLDVRRELGRPGGTLEEWFPDELRPTTKRLKGSDFGSITIRFIWSILTNREPTKPGDRNPYTNRLYEASANNLLL